MTQALNAPSRPAGVWMVALAIVAMLLLCAGGMAWELGWRLHNTINVEIGQPVALSVGARVCSSENDLLQVTQQHSAAPLCFTAGGDMQARVVGTGSNPDAVMVSVDGMSGDRWVPRDALVRQGQ